MLQKALVPFLILASLAGGIGCGTTANHYIYATLGASNQIAVYREDPNSGVLTQLSGSPYTGGDGANSVVIHPSGKFLYVSNPGQNENDISLFDIASNGALTEVLPRTSVAPMASQPQLLAMDPNGAFLYVANAASSNISVFAIDSGSGALSTVANSPFPIGLAILNMQLTPSGNLLFVTAVSQPFGLIEGFSVSGGVLQLIGVTPTDGINPTGLAIDPGGTHLYAANTSSNSISIFAIDSAGGLAEVTGSPINDEFSNPIALLFDAEGSFLYVANQGSNNVAAYSIDSSTGLPAILTTSTATGAFSTESSPSFLALDSGGKYLFVGNQGSAAGLQVFGISSGNLTTLSTYTVGNTPTSIAVLSR